MARNEYNWQYGPQDLRYFPTCLCSFSGNLLWKFSSTLFPVTMWKVNLLVLDFMDKDYLISYLLLFQKKCFSLRTYVGLIEYSLVFWLVVSKTLKIDLEKKCTHKVLPIMIPIGIIAVVRRRGLAFTGGWIKPSLRSRNWNKAANKRIFKRTNVHWGMEKIFRLTSSALNSPVWLSYWVNNNINKRGQKHSQMGLV